MFDGRGRWLSYRTVLACISIGAPDSTAAGRMPSSLPSWTCLGTGVKVLQDQKCVNGCLPVRLAAPEEDLGELVRGGHVNGRAVVGHVPREPGRGRLLLLLDCPGRDLGALVAAGRGEDGSAGVRRRAQQPGCRGGCS